MAADASSSFAFASLPAALDGVGDAVRHVVVEQLQRHGLQRPGGGRHLLEDIDAVPVLFDHTLQPRTCPSMRRRRFWTASFSSTVARLASITYLLYPLPVLSISWCALSLTQTAGASGGPGRGRGRGGDGTGRGGDGTGPNYVHAMTESQHITIDTTDGPMPAFEASPEEDPKGGIVVVQEAFGVTAASSRTSPSGWPMPGGMPWRRPSSTAKAAPVIAYDDFAAVMPVMKELNADGITVDLVAAFAHLEAAGFPAARQRHRGVLHGRQRDVLRGHPAGVGRRRDVLRRWRGRGPVRTALARRAGSQARRHRGSDSTVTSIRGSPRPKSNSFAKPSPE